MIGQALAEVGKKYGISVGAKAKGREARHIETALYSVHITTDSRQAILAWSLNIPAIEARAEEIGRPDGVSRLVSKLFGGSGNGTAANWRFCAMVGEKAFDITGAETFASIERQAAVSSKISDELSIPLNPIRPDTAVFFVMFDHERRFAVDSEVAAMLQHEPAATLGDASALKDEVDLVAEKVWGKGSGALNGQDRDMEEILRRVEVRAMLRTRLEERGLNGDELEDAVEDGRRYLHQALKKYIG